MRRAALVVVLAAATTAASAGSQPEIVDGTPTSAYPAVGAILDAAGEEFCTGFLVSSSCLLTAAHCVDAIDELHTVHFGPAIDQPYEAKVNATGAARIHPLYDGKSPDHDLAIVPLLSDPGLTPFATASAPEVAATVTLVGFGLDPVDSGTKREADLQVDGVVGSVLVLDGSASACGGDSGGPVLEAEGEDFLAVAVIVAGSTECDDVTLATRLDVQGSWLAAALAEAECDATATGNGIFIGNFDAGLGGWDSPLATCSPERCGAFDENAFCQCDAQCPEFGDCCANACDVCGVCV